MKNIIRNSVALSFLVLVISGCSSKRVYEPQNVTQTWKEPKQIEAAVADIGNSAALLENSKVLFEDKVLDFKISDEYRLLGISDGWVLSSSVEGDLTLEYLADATLKKEFELKKTIASASIQDDLLAVLFADNEMALYSISSKELLFKEQGGAPLVLDSRIVSPHFMKDLVLYLTLDGKIVIVNAQLKKKLRTVIVSSKEHFNNVIFFHILDDKLLAATSHTLLSLAQQEVRVDYEIRDVAYDEKNLYIATKQGEIISLTPDLQINAKVKFPFAHFLGLIYKDDTLYALEKEGYLIALNKDLQSYEIYEAEISEGYTFSSNTTFYTDDLALDLE